MTKRTNMLNIAIVHEGGSEIGGGRVWLTEICDRLDNRGHNAMVIMSGEGSIPPPFSYQVVPYSNVRFRPERIKFLANIPALAERLRSFDPDIVIFETRQWRAKIFERILNVPTVAYYHSVPPHTHLISSIDRLLTRNVRLVMTNSFYMQARIKKLYRLDDVRVVYPGVDIEKYKPIGEQGEYMLHLSRISPEKKIEFLVHVVRALKHSAVSKRLVIAGPCLEKNKQYIKKLESISPPTVSYRTNISENEKIRLLQNCSFFLHPPLEEAFGIAPLEAMACGKPVIASSSSFALKETVGKGGGILCPPVFSLWAKAIETISSNEKLADRLGKKAREIALRFSWSETVDNLERNLSSCLKN